MRALWVVALVMVTMGTTGCGRRRVVVANTPEGNACRRECMGLFNECQGGKRRNRKACTARENECLTTCPGVVAAESRGEDMQEVQQPMPPPPQQQLPPPPPPPVP